MKNIWVIALIGLMLGLTSCPGGDDKEREVYSVIFETNGGEPVPDVQKVEVGDKASVPYTNPVKSGYVFMYWYLIGTDVAYNFQTPVTRDIILNAKWQEETMVEYWTISWQLNGGTWPSEDNHVTQVVKGGILTEPAAPVKTGNTFDGWYKEAALVNKVSFPYDVSQVTGDFTLYSKWTTVNIPGEEASPTTLYIAGKDASGACYWIVDLATNVITKKSLTVYGEANDVVVSGNDVYISGYQTTTLISRQACYWKNGELEFITKSSDDFEAYGIAVSGKDIYMAGRDYFTGTGKPCYWKNGVKIDLPISTKGGWTTGISLSGNDVYISGGEDSDAPCYWKNGNRTPLKSAHSTRETRSIFVSGTDVYVSGRVRYPGWTACYWKNGSFVALTDGKYNAWANGITVSGGKVYTAGFEETSDSKIHAVCYWENERKVILEQEKYSYAYDIAVSGQNIYVVGHVYDAKTENYVACYWKNGVRFNLDDGKEDTEALAVALSWK